jgi:hypothetical protein
MIETCCYDSPQALFHPDFISLVVAKSQGRRTVIISANATHAQALKTPTSTS